MKLVLLPLAASAIALIAAHKPDCPPHFDIGQTYHEVQQGPCPDIDSVASYRAEDSVHVIYLCRSRSIAVVGNMRTGKVDGFFLNVDP